MPNTRAGARGTDPFEQARLAARELLRHTTVDGLDVLVVLGDSLTSIPRALGAGGTPIDMTSLPWFPRFTGTGHRPEAWLLTIGTSRVLFVTDRLHLSEGFTPAEVVHTVRTGLAAGCRTVILTCSAGAVGTGLEVGHVVVVADHLNLTATSPLTGVPPEHPGSSPNVDLTDAWSPRLRRMVHDIEPSLPEGVYAQVPGPHLETPAEVRMLATLGADMVGMSMVPELIAARHLGAEVLGLAVVSGPAGAGIDGHRAGSPGNPAGEGLGQISRIIQGVVERLGTPRPAPGG